MNSNVETKFSIKKNDQVQVIAGKEKGKTGKVLSVSAKTGRVTVEKTNMVKRHTKPTQGSPQGGLVEKESALHYSNVLLFCTKCNKGVRHGHKFVTKTAGKKGSTTAAKPTKIRVCKKCGESLETA